MENTARFEANSKTSVFYKSVQLLFSYEMTTSNWFFMSWVTFGEKSFLAEGSMLKVLNFLKTFFCVLHCFETIAQLEITNFQNVFGIWQKKERERERRDSFLKKNLINKLSQSSKMFMVYSWLNRQFLKQVQSFISEPDQLATSSKAEH